MGLFHRSRHRVETDSVNECRFCGREVHESAGGMQTFGGSVDDVDTIYAAVEKAAAEMLAEKRTCDSCSAVFCLECGNAEGRKRGLGSTNCPACGRKMA